MEAVAAGKRVCYSQILGGGHTGHGGRTGLGREAADPRGNGAKSLPCDFCGMGPADEWLVWILGRWGCPWAGQGRWVTAGEQEPGKAGEGSVWAGLCLTVVL